MGDSNNGKHSWIEVRDHSGRMLFKYNPWTNTIEMKRGGASYTIVKLDELRQKHGVLAQPSTPEERPPAEYIGRDSS